VLRVLLAPQEQLERPVQLAMSDLRVLPVPRVLLVPRELQGPRSGLISATGPMAQSPWVLEQRR
jgi:hypothetical protein